ncbi:MAG: hypothetical protein ACI9SB_002248, partial [Candidatus Azotimanducaceae bacterium]
LTPLTPLTPLAPLAANGIAECNLGDMSALTESEADCWM